jgi:hypothetical protein
MKIRSGFVSNSSSSSFIIPPPKVRADVDHIDYYDFGDDLQKIYKLSDVKKFLDANVSKDEIDSVPYIHSKWYDLIPSYVYYSGSGSDNEVVKKNVAELYAKYPDWYVTKLLDPYDNGNLGRFIEAWFPKVVNHW